MNPLHRKLLHTMLQGWGQSRTNSEQFGVSNVVKLQQVVSMLLVASAFLITFSYWTLILYGVLTIPFAAVGFSALYCTILGSVLGRVLNFCAGGLAAFIAFFISNAVVVLEGPDYYYDSTLDYSVLAIAFIPVLAHFVLALPLTAGVIERLESSSKGSEADST